MKTSEGKKQVAFCSVLSQSSLAAPHEAGALTHNFTDEKREVQQGRVTCPPSSKQQAAEVTFYLT